MKRRLLLGLLIACGLGLSGCASAPIHHYTLMAPVQTSGIPINPPVNFLLDVLPVAMPAQIDRQALVIRQGENGIAILDGERWTAPFSEEFRDALSDSLTRSLGTQDIAGLASAKGKRVLRIKLQVRRMDAWLGQQVQLEVTWMLRFASDETARPLTCHAQFAIAAPGSYSELVGAQQRAIMRLVAEIAADARNFENSPPTSCAATLP